MERRHEQSCGAEDWRAGSRQGDALRRRYPGSPCLCCSSRTWSCGESGNGSQSVERRHEDSCGAEDWKAGSRQGDALRTRYPGSPCLCCSSRTWSCGESGNGSQSVERRHDDSCGAEDWRAGSRQGDALRRRCLGGCRWRCGCSCGSGGGGGDCHSERRRHRGPCLQTEKMQLSAERSLLGWLHVSEEGATPIPPMLASQ